MQTSEPTQPPKPYHDQYPPTPTTPYPNPAQAVRSSGKDTNNRPRNQIFRPTQMSGGSDFRVVIAGASIAGLSLALALERAGVDFVVLEAHPSVAPQVGASIAVLPSGARVLDQLGCYADVAGLVSCSTDNFIIRDAGGEKLIHIENLEEHLVQRSVALSDFPSSLSLPLCLRWWCCYCCVSRG